MRYVLTKFITFSPENVSGEVYWVLCGIYAVLLIVSLLSVFSIKSNFGTKLAWFSLVVLLPVLGMILYCIRCLICADYQFLKQFGFASSNKMKEQMKIVPRSETSKSAT